MFLLDTNFVLDLEKETATGIVGPARNFLGIHRGEKHAISIITVGEVAAGSESELMVRQFLACFTWLAFKPQIAFAAGAIDRELRSEGLRLGENDNWIAGFGRYYSATVVTRDLAFRRVRRLKFVSY